MPDTESKNDLGVPAGAGALPSNWVAHFGNDYTVVMLPGETTENASITVYNADPRVAHLIAAAPAMKEALHEMTCEYRRELGNEFQKIAWDKARAALKLAEI